MHPASDWTFKRMSISRPLSLPNFSQICLLTSELSAMALPASDSRRVGLPSPNLDGNTVPAASRFGLVSQTTGTTRNHDPCRKHCAREKSNESDPIWQVL